MNRSHDLGHVRVILPFPAHALCAQHLLLEPLGIARDEGITVSVQFTESPLDASAAVAAGDYDVTEVNTLFAFARREAGVPIKAFYSICRAAYRGFAVPAQSPIQTIEQLRHATVGTDHPDLLGLAGPVLRAHGVDPGEIDWITDYLRDVVPTEDDRHRLRHGALDAVWVLACSFEMLAADGIPLRRLPSAQLAGLTPGACLYAHDDALSDDRHAALAAYARGIARTTRFCQEDPEQAVRLVWESDPRTRPTGDHTRALRRDAAAIHGRNLVCDLRHGDEPAWGAASEREIKNWEAFLRNSGTVTEQRPAEEYFALGFAAEAVSARVAAR